MMLIVPLLIVVGLLYYFFAGAGSVSTDNAAVKQDIVSVSAQVNGPIVDVRVKNGDRVKRGDLLFRIDPDTYRVALEQAQAQLAAAKLQTTQLRRRRPEREPTSPALRPISASSATRCRVRRRC